jgi:hypothetical protein
MRKQTKIATRWFLAVLFGMCAATLGFGMLVLTEPAKPRVPPSKCQELMRMHGDNPPAHLVIKCKGLV